MIVRVLAGYDGQRATVEDDDDFFNEVCILSRLDHVNIVGLIGYVVASRPFMIVTQPLAVGCLRDYLRYTPAISSDTTAQSLLLRMCRQMSSAVAYLAARRYDCYGPNTSNMTPVFTGSVYRPLVYTAR